ncbi:MAG: flippase activity-associated protein Agl23 [Terrimicrobiaceae bacterium]
MVNGQSDLEEGLRAIPNEHPARRIEVLRQPFPRLALAPPAHYFNRVRERLAKLPWVEIGILLVAAVLRTVLVDIKPPHFDEGINGWFADQMRINGFYHYDPTNYHGPLHFYAVFLSQTLFGRNLWALRLPAIIPALLAVWALLRYREFFGTTAARWAAAAMAVSPAFVFYGRYSIHESWMVLFSILLLWAVLGLWEKGERRFLFTLILALTGMILTKETYVVHVGCLILAGGVLWAWQKVLPSRPAFPIARQLWSGRDAGNSLALALLAIVFFYSGNFLDWAGLKGLYETYAAWFHTGVQAGGHEKNTFRLWDKDWLNYYWVALMARYEWPALAGLLACARYVVPSDARLRYVAISAGGVLMAYSIIPYKTPWCIISILWPFYLILGAIIQEASTTFKASKLLRPATLAAFLLLAISLGMSIRLNFFHFTNEKEPYVYVQTYAEIETLTKPLLEMTAKDPRAYHLRGQSVLESYYPLPWILGDFTDIGYFNTKSPPATFDGDFVLAESSEAAEVEPKLAGSYYKRTFRLRDAQEECVVYFREEPFRNWFEGAAPEITNPPPP